MNDELVSVYITTKNRPDLLVRAIKSVLNQTHEAVELFIIDDASTVDITPIIEECTTSAVIPVHYIKNEVSRGACFSRNLAIEKAAGKYVTGLDDDDEFMPDRIEKLLAAYKPEYAFVAAKDMMLKPNGEKIYAARPSLVTLQVLLNSAQNLMGNQVFTEKYKYQAVGGFDIDFPAFQDYDMFYRMVKNFGNAPIIDNGLQIIYRNDDVVRITGLFNQCIGIVKFYLKHRGDMSRKQKLGFVVRYRLLKLHLFQDRRFKLATLFDILLNSSSTSLKHNLKSFIKLVKAAENIA